MSASAVALAGGGINGLIGRYNPIPAFLEWDRPDAMLVPNVVRKSVVFLGEGHGDAFSPKGTAFVVSVAQGGFRFVHLVTAEHVIVRRSDPMYARVNLVAGGTRDIPIRYNDWWHHPDPGVSTDLAVLPTSIDRGDIIYSHNPIDSFATDEVIAKNGIGVGDEVFATGLFASHYGKGQNLPIVRTGNIALMPDEPVLTRFVGYIDAYLIETRSIAGLSGSPVWVHMPPIRVVKGRASEYEGPQFFLLGLVQGRFNVKAQDEDLANETDGDRDDRINSGIGVVVPAQRIAETLLQPDLVALRQRIVDQKRAGEGADSQAVGAEREPPTTDANPQHKEDFTRLLNAAARKPTQGGGT